MSGSAPHKNDLLTHRLGTAGTLVAAGLRGGFNLRRHENILVSPGVAYPREIFASTRILLVPSVWDEPSGRVASEALVNGVPPIVSNRGGLPEECRGAGIVLSLSKELTVETQLPVSAAAVQPWIDAVVRMIDNEAHYQAESRRAFESGKNYLPGILKDRYVKFFQGVMESS